MKRAQILSTATLALLVFTARSNADTPLPDSPLNPYTTTDGDGVPLAVLHADDIKITQQRDEMARQIQMKSDNDRNWLIRGYQDQLKAQSAANPSIDMSSNLYYQLSQNKDLAKLAGIPAANPDDNSDSNGGLNNSSRLQLGAKPTPPPPVAPPAPAQPETPPPAPLSTNPLQSAFGLKPFISPLGTPDSGSSHDFYASLATAGVSPFGSDATSNTSNTTTAAVKTSTESSAQDAMDVETPGMMAARKDSPYTLESQDISLDVLPGQTPEQARADRLANTNPLELPLPQSVDQMHQSQQLALTIQQPNQVFRPPSPPARPVAVEDPSTRPAPVKPPVITPVHAPIANPFDILDR